MAKINLSALDRLPPQSPEAEIAVLGSLMLDKDAIVQVADQVLPEDFYELRHQIIYQAMLELFEKNVSIDLLTLSNLLAEKQQLEKISGAGYLAELANAVPSASHVLHYATIVRKKGTLRRLIQSAG